MANTIITLYLKPHKATLDSEAGYYTATFNISKDLSISNGVSESQIKKVVSAKYSSFDPDPGAYHIDADPLGLPRAEAGTYVSFVIKFPLGTNTLQTVTTYDILNHFFEIKVELYDSDTVHITGYWIFNSYLNFKPTGTITETISFDCSDASTYSQFTYVYNAARDIVNISYKTTTGTAVGAYGNFGTGVESWEDNSRRMINFGIEGALVSPVFYELLTNNATLQGSIDLENTEWFLERNKWQTTAGYGKFSIDAIEYYNNPYVEKECSIFNIGFAGDTKVENCVTVTNIGDIFTTNESYVLRITGGQDTGSIHLYNWLHTNAQQVGAKIIYNNIDTHGSGFAILGRDHTATLECKGKRPYHNVQITDTSAYTSVQYAGKTIADIIAGKSAMIECVDKVMQDNLVVKTFGPTPGINYQPVYNYFDIVQYSCNGVSSDCAFSDLVIADKIEGYQVRTISNSAFKDNKVISSIYIGHHISSIGQEAFRNCSNLTKVIIPNNDVNVFEILSRAFMGCTKLSSIEIPDKTVSLGYAALYNTGIEYAVIGTGLTNIANECFKYCSKLKAIYLKGTQEITLGEQNSSWDAATKYYYSATKPTTTGNYWHYVNGIPTPW